MNQFEKEIEEQIRCAQCLIQKAIGTYQVWKDYFDRAYVNLCPVCAEEWKEAGVDIRPVEVHNE